MTNEKNQTWEEELKDLIAGRRVFFDEVSELVHNLLAAKDEEWRENIRMLDKNIDIRFSPLCELQIIKKRIYGLLADQGKE